MSMQYQEKKILLNDISSNWIFFIGWNIDSRRHLNGSTRCFCVCVCEPLRRMLRLKPNLSAAIYSIQSNLTYENLLNGERHSSCLRIICRRKQIMYDFIWFNFHIFASALVSLLRRTANTHSPVRSFFFISIRSSSSFQLRSNYFQEQKTITICFFYFIFIRFCWMHVCVRAIMSISRMREFCSLHIGELRSCVLRNCYTHRMCLPFVHIFHPMCVCVCVWLRIKTVYAYFCLLRSLCISFILFSVRFLCVLFLYYCDGLGTSTE